MSEPKSLAGGVSQSPLLYAALPGTTLPISDHELLFVPEGRDDRHIMTADVYAALEQCAEFATLDEHVRRLSRSFPKLGVANIQRVLENLVQRGVFMAHPDLLAKLTASTQTAASVPLRSMAILSLGHPAALEALLGSIAEGTPQRDRSFALIDGGEVTELRARKVELMAEFGRRTGQRVVLLDGKRERWLAERVQQMPEHAEGLELLFGKRAGARARAVNLALIAHAGERILLLDDQQRLRTYGTEQPVFALGGGSGRKPRVYESTDAAVAAWPRGLDLWSLAEARLGKSLGELVPEPQLHGRRVEDFYGYAGARAASLALGVLGSADTEHALWLFHVPAEDRKRLADREALQNALSGDATYLGCAETTLSSAPALPACAWDLSGSAGFAFGDDHGCDVALAALARFADPLGLQLVCSEALERRAPGFARGENNREPLSTGFARFLADQVASLQGLCLAESSTARWRWLASQLRDLADASLEERVQVLWRYLTGRRAQLIAELQQVLMRTTTDVPEVWRQELLLTVQAQAEALLQARSPNLKSFARNLSATGAADAMSAELRNVALAADAWAALWPQAQAARWFA